MNKSKKKKRRSMWVFLIVIFVIAIAILLFVNQPSFGRIPRGERQVSIEQVENYHNGKFHNITPSTVMSSDKSKLASMWDFLFRTIPDLRPEHDIPTIATDLGKLDPNADVVVWLGHSTMYIQLSGTKILLDPVLVYASPVSFVNRSFNGADRYNPNDIPDLDYMIVTHDHWDHLDYRTVKALKERTGKVICGLGVGEHFERWGFDKERIIELYWGETTLVENDITVHCLPSRHFSGRGLSADKTLWVSYMLQTSKQNIYISGDTGYDAHFSHIGKHFDHIDFAIMENGQYDEDWKDIHLMPDNLVRLEDDNMIYSVISRRKCRNIIPLRNPGYSAFRLLGEVYLRRSDYTSCFFYFEVANLENNYDHT